MKFKVIRSDNQMLKWEVWCYSDGDFKPPAGNCFVLALGDSEVEALQNAIMELENGVDELLIKESYTAGRKK